MYFDHNDDLKECQKKAVFVRVFFASLLLCRSTRMRKETVIHFTPLLAQKKLRNKQNSGFNNKNTHAYNYILIHVLLELTIFDSWLLLCCIWWLFPNNDNQLFYSVAKVKSQNKSRNNKIIVKIKCCVDLLYSRETRMQCRPKFTCLCVVVLRCRMCQTFSQQMVLP